MLLMTKELEKIRKVSVVFSRRKKELYHLLVLRLNENNMSLAVK